MAGRAARASTTIPSILPGSSPSASDANHPTLTPKVRMLGYDWPRFHAAVNDFPAALLFVTVLFDIAAWLTKRDSLKSAALWTLWAGVTGGWVAVLAGLKAEDVIEHGEAGGAEEHEHAAPADTAKQGGHTHAPGTPPDKH